MKVVIRFRTAQGTYAVPITDALEVRSAEGLMALPSPAVGVAGVVERDGVTIPVVAVLGAGDRHIVIVTDGSDDVGVLAEEVLGVAQVADQDVGPPPPGQEDPLVEAVVREDGAMTFVLDVAELVRHVRERQLDLLLVGHGNEGASEVPLEDADGMELG